MEESTPQPNPDVIAPGKKILLIEDETFIGELYVRALKNGGYDPKIIIDGQEALEEAKTNAYDIILLDIMLPNVTGTDILQELRKVPDFKAKIIITTNLELGEEGRMKIETQADGYLVKADITPKELVAFLDQMQPHEDGGASAQQNEPEA